MEDGISRIPWEKQTIYGWMDGIPRKRISTPIGLREAGEFMDGWKQEKCAEVVKARSIYMLYPEYGLEDPP